MIKNWIKNTANFILTGSISVVFAACYGAQMLMDNPKSIKVKDQDENPIPGLKITILEDQTEISESFTDEQGIAEFSFPEYQDIKYSAKIEDIDGEDNLGDFATNEVDFTSTSFLSVKLDKKQ